VSADTIQAKPYASLSRADLQQYPVWQWVLDEDCAAGAELVDESFVWPTEHAQIPKAEFAQFVVASSIKLKDGTAFPGIAELTVANGKVAIQPNVVFLLDRQLTIPGVETNRLLTRYAKTVENYPVGWTLNVLIDGETKPRSGKIHGGDMKDIVAAGMLILMSLKALRGKSDD